MAKFARQRNETIVTQSVPWFRLRDARFERVDWVELFPQDAFRRGARIIVLTRDPRAVACSTAHFARSKKRKLALPSVEQVVADAFDEDLQVFSGWHAHVAQSARAHSDCLNFT